MNENTKKLIELIRDNPGLPIAPMVDYEIVEDGYGRWLGGFGHSYVGEYIIGDERVYFRDDEDIWGTLYGVLGRDAYESITAYDQAKQEYDRLPWVKAIIVDIDLPKEEPR